MEDATKCEQRWSRDSPRCEGAVPLPSGKDPSELRSEPRERLKTVHRSVDLGSAWMEEHIAAHAAVLAFATVSFHCARASAAALLFNRLGVRLCFQMRRVDFMWS